MLEKTTENSEQLGQQAQPRNEPDTSRLPLVGSRMDSLTSAFRGFEPGAFGVAAGSSNRYTAWPAPVMRAEPLDHRWGSMVAEKLHKMYEFL